MFIYDFYRTKLEMEESPSFSIPTAKIITINIKTNHPLKIAALAFKPVTKSKKKIYKQLLCLFMISTGQMTFQTSSTHVLVQADWN